MLHPWVGILCEDPSLSVNCCSAAPPYCSLLCPLLQSMTNQHRHHPSPPHHFAGVFANNRASGVLRRDHPTSVHDLVMLYGDESYWGFLKVCFRGHVQLPNGP